MNEADRKRSASDAAGRLFRAYEQHCRAPGTDTLFHTLTAIHSLNDRLENAVSRDFHKIDEFLALKTLRNFVHHQDDVRSNVRVVPSPAISDLMILCLVRRDQVIAAIDGVHERWRSTTEVACQSKFHWYGQAVNINPCLFNFMVHAYEFLIEVDVSPPPSDVKSFADSYQFEIEHDHSHFVDGRIMSVAGEIEEFLTAMVEGLPER